MFKLAKASAIKSRTQAINQLKAVLVSADPAAARGYVRAEQPHADPALRRPRRRHAGDATTAAAYTLALLARRILELTTRDRRSNRSGSPRR